MAQRVEIVLFYEMPPQEIFPDKEHMPSSLCLKYIRNHLFLPLARIFKATETPATLQREKRRVLPQCFRFLGVWLTSTQIFLNRRQCPTTEPEAPQGEWGTWPPLTPLLFSLDPPASQLGSFLQLFTGYLSWASLALRGVQSS